MKIKWAKEGDWHSYQELYQLRAELVKGIEPLQTQGADLHHVFLSLNRKANR